MIGGDVVNDNFGANVTINFMGDSVKEYSAGAGSANFLHINKKICILLFYHQNIMNIKMMVAYLRDFNSCSC